MSEQGQVTGPVIEALNAIPNVIAFRIHSGRKNLGGRWIHLGPKGMPDVGVCVRGKALFFEAKIDKNQPTEDQLRQHERLRRAGADVRVIRSVGEALDAVREILERKGA
jgi:hypothetical protein